MTIPGLPGGDAYDRGAAAFRSEMRASFAPERSASAIIGAGVGEPLKDLTDLVAHLQRKIDAALAGRSLYGLPVRTSTLVPPDEVWIIEESDGELHRDESRGYEYARVTRVAIYNPRDGAGYPSRTARAVKPTPGYTRHMLGAHEAARDWRRYGRPRTRRDLERLAARVDVVSTADKDR